nr:MAG TPA: hypothetical protein [Caudoviricetes sp.]
MTIIFTCDKIQVVNKCLPIIKWRRNATEEQEIR